MTPKSVPGYCGVGLSDSKASSINRLTTAFECVPSLRAVPISLPICPCSIRQLRIGADSIPNNSRCLSLRYSVNVSVFQSLMSRARQSEAGGRLFRLAIRYPLLKPFRFNYRRKTHTYFDGIIFDKLLAIIH